MSSLELDEDEIICRIQIARFRRGQDAGLAGEYPTEANEDYQRGYIEGWKKLNNVRD